MKKTSFAAVVLLAGAALVVGVATAHTTRTIRFPTKVTATYELTPGEDTINGEVSFSGHISAGNGCKARRNVTVVSSRSDGIGTTTDARGNFKTRPDLIEFEDNPFRIVAGRKTIRRNGRIHKCLEGVSRKITVER